MSAPPRSPGARTWYFLALAWCVGCVGARFASREDARTDEARPDLDAPTRVVVERIGDLRRARKLPPPSLVPDLHTPASRAAVLVARGDESLKTAAHRAAIQAVAAFGRHVWTFATECTDLAKFQPPRLAIDSQQLLLGAAAVPAPGGRTMVVLVIAEPGSSSLRADQMGGGPGGTNPTPETYAHPSAATGPCGERWPAIQPAPL